MDVFILYLANNLPFLGYDVRITYILMSEGGGSVKYFRFKKAFRTDCFDFLPPGNLMTFGAPVIIHAQEKLSSVILNALDLASMSTEIVLQSAQQGHGIIPLSWFMLTR